MGGDGGVETFLHTIFFYPRLPLYLSINSDITNFKNFLITGYKYPKIGKENKNAAKVCFFVQI